MIATSFVFARESIATLYLYYDTTQELIVTCLVAISQRRYPLSAEYYFSDTSLFPCDYKSRARGGWLHGKHFPPENSLSPHAVNVYSKNRSDDENGKRMPDVLLLRHTKPKVKNNCFWSSSLVTFAKQ